MKKITVFCVVLLTASILFGQTPQKRLIHIEGKAKIDTVADRAYISYSVTGYGSTLRDAVKNAQLNNAAIAAKIIEKGIKKEWLETSNFYSGENGGDKPFLSSKKDYQASLTTIVKIDNLAILDEVVYSLSAQSVENMSGLTFELKNMDSLNLVCRVKAIANAVAEAQALASAAGIKVGRIADIGYGSFGSFNDGMGGLGRRGVVMAKSMAYEAAPSGGIFPNRISVEARVNIDFEIAE
jgi:uncharacterized protein YggE